MDERFEIHPIATLFPSMSEVDRDHLKASLMHEGQLEEILLFEGQILDGRHRYETCLELGLEPRVREFSGDLQAAFAHSVALNLSRRHLTTVQRAAAGAGIKEFQQRILRGGEPAPEPGSAGSGPEPIQVAIDEDAPTIQKKQPKAKQPKQPKQLSERTINSRARDLASKQVGVSGRAIDTASKIKDEAPDVFERMLAGTAGSLPDAKKVTALPQDVRAKVHALVDEGTKLNAALRQVNPETPSGPGPVFLGKVLLDPEEAETFERILAAREIKRSEAAHEALVDWIAKHADQALLTAAR